jgi:hypothetical protein
VDPQLRTYDIERLLSPSPLSHAAQRATSFSRFRSEDEIFFFTNLQSLVAFIEESSLPHSTERIFPPTQHREQLLSLVLEVKKTIFFTNLQSLVEFIDESSLHTAHRAVVLNLFCSVDP